MTQNVKGLEMFRTLITAGCTWAGDVCSAKWGDVLYFTDDKKEAVVDALYCYEAGTDYKLEDGGVWIV